MDYPEELENVAKLFYGKFCLYILKVEPEYYKYGITSQISNRLRKHYRGLNFLEIVNVFDCVSGATMTETETQLGRLAKTNGERIKKYDKTEIIFTKDITQYLKFILEKITELNNLTQPQNIAEPAISNTAVILRRGGYRAAKNIPIISEENKCDLCGKDFKKESNLQRHRDKKTPCVITVVTDDMKNNPNRCIQCNKIFANKGNLNKHSAICKVENSEMKALADNIQKDRELDELRERVNKLEKIIQNLQLGVVNNINNTFNAPATANFQ